MDLHWSVTTGERGSCLKACVIRGPRPFERLCRTEELIAGSALKSLRMCECLLVARRRVGCVACLKEEHSGSQQDLQCGEGGKLHESVEGQLKHDEDECLPRIFEGCANVIGWKRHRK